MFDSKRKPSLELHRKIKKQQSRDDKLHKIQIFYRYRIGSIYRQMKIPIYEKILGERKPTSSKTPKAVTNSKNENKYTENDIIQSLYKFVSLNSKYHHRQKMRFSRTPLMKYIQYDFNKLVQKLKTKQYASLYDDLVESDQEDNQEENKKQYQKDPQFSQISINNYKKKSNISGKIVIAEGYDDLKARLVSKYGWTQNKESGSLIYDFKYMSKKKDIDYTNILDSQIVNHFHQNKSITAKFGLARNIRNIVSLGKDHNQFFPRCYDINDVKQLQDFYQDFKFTHAKRILQDYICNSGNIGSNRQQIVVIAIKCLQLDNLPIDAKINQIVNDRPIYITQEQWDVLSRYDFASKTQFGDETHRNEKLFEVAMEMRKELQKSDPQYFLNKQNTWIVKPASMSRGRGIKTFNDLTQILDYIVGKQISWVVQKYIQRPFILRKKKFDIRQWVILTDFKPFRVWIYDQCYIRFCSQAYEPQNLKNRKIHLTNNSVTKGINSLQDGISQNMMSEKQFSEQLNILEGKDVFKNVIKVQLEKIAVQSLQSVKQNIVFRKNTFQLFGFDFMVDQNYKAWLIEVNSSPTMQHSTQTTTKIVRRGMSDLADLLENYMLKGKLYDKPNAGSSYGGWKLLTNQ